MSIVLFKFILLAEIRIWNSSSRHCTVITLTILPFGDSVCRCFPLVFAFMQWDLANRKNTSRQCSCCAANEWHVEGWILVSFLHREIGEWAVYLDLGWFVMRRAYSCRASLLAPEYETPTVWASGRQQARRYRYLQGDRSYDLGRSSSIHDLQLWARCSWLS